MDKSDRTFLTVIIGVLLLVFMLFVIITGINTIQTKRNTLILDYELQPKRVLIDVQTQDTIYVYDISDK